MSYGLCVPTGTYFGDGYTSLGSGSSYSGSGYNKVVTSANINSMSRNTGAGYDFAMTEVGKYIKNGEIEKALSKYQELFDEIKASNSYGNKTIDNYQVQTIMSNAFISATGCDITDAVDSKTAKPIVSGLLQGIPIIGLFVEDTTRAEAYAALDNENVSFKDKAKEYGGAMASGAAAGAAIGTALGSWSFGIGTAVGAAIGAGVGALQTFLKDIL